MMAYKIYKGNRIEFINSEQHKELMRYWDEEHDGYLGFDIKVPFDDVDSYMCKCIDINGNYYWDCIQVMRNKNGSVHLFGCSLYNMKNCFKWFINEYDSEDELVEQDIAWHKKQLQKERETDMKVYVLSLRIDCEDSNPASEIIGVFKEVEYAEKERDRLIRELCEEEEINYDELVGYDIFDGENYYFYEITETELQ